MISGKAFRMKFTYFAGRYFGVEGLMNIQNFVICMEMRFPVHGRGMEVFTVMMSVINQIYDLVEKAVEANMLSVHTDRSDH